jgi:hypothetical protein
MMLSRWQALKHHPTLLDLAQAEFQRRGHRRRGVNAGQKVQHRLQAAVARHHIERHGANAGNRHSGVKFNCHMRGLPYVWVTVGDGFSAFRAA